MRTGAARGHVASFTRLASTAPTPSFARNGRVGALSPQASLPLSVTPAADCRHAPARLAGSGVLAARIRHRPAGAALSRTT